MKRVLARKSSLSFLRTIWLYILIIPVCACLTQSRTAPVTNNGETQRRDVAASSLININTASTVQLEKLPGIGPGLASRIVEHRERYGRFRRPEHLIMVRGLSHRRYLVLRPLISVE